MAPPENALVLCVDEKSQIQALDRTAPCLPMLPTTPARMTHDYVRNGTTSLFAAFDLASGSVIAQHYRQHRHQEFLRFLKLIDAAVPKDLDLHLVLDNYGQQRMRLAETSSFAAWRARPDRRARALRRAWHWRTAVDDRHPSRTTWTSAPAVLGQADRVNPALLLKRIAHWSGSRLAHREASGT